MTQKFRFAELYNEYLINYADIFLNTQNIFDNITGMPENYYKKSMFSINLYCEGYLINLFNHEEFN